AYCRIFARCGLEYLPVEAESGPIGGEASHEFMCPATNGEDRIVHCRATGYAANLERADTGRTPPVIATSPEAKPIAKLHTPNVGSIEAVCKFLKCKPQRMIKTLIYSADDKPVAVLIRGDHEANESKIRRALGITKLEMASPDVIQQVTGAPVGFAGPVGIQCPLIADHDVPVILNAITGANEEDHHFTNVNVVRDYSLEKTFDLRNAEAGDPSPRGEGTLELVHGIEVGHVFKLGTKYTIALEARYSDEKEQRQPIIMGCYGIGVNRILAALAETKNDENGLIWPLSVAPYEVIVLPLQEEPAVLQAAEAIYSQLQQLGVDVLLDDRAQRAGVKFKDADLIGFPLRVVIGGKGLQEGQIELKWRTDTVPSKVPVADAVASVLKQLAERRVQEAANVPA
ncbi:MAG TPA: proline--tRNA ligase, partial [Planctomycetaceae bacterium]|nr:proline--tRNA ligase [Planctomycetaceae bacterium]